MSNTELYSKLPRFIQNIATNVYGMKREITRYGGSFKKTYNRLLELEYADKQTILKYQEEQLRKLLINAAKTTHYRKIFDELNIDVQNDKPFDVLAKMPILSKNELRGHEKDFYTGHRNNDQVFHTSGSTGTPISVVTNIEDFHIRMAVLERMKKRFGISHKDRHISFVGKKITKENDRVFWRSNVPGHQLVMSVYDMSDANKYIYLEKIKKFRPVMIEGYPSAISVLAKWVLEENFIITLKAVLVTAETLSEEQKQTIEKAFNCSTVNYYGSTEGAPMITQCEYGHMHFDMETGIIEFLNDKGEKADSGEPARMIVTSFASNSTPLIRYDIGDLALFTGKCCKCNRPGIVIDEIIGRVDDTFITPEKGYVGRLSTSFKLFSSKVNRTQIQQLSPSKFKLLVETDAEIDDNEINTVVEDLHTKLGQVNIDVEIVKEIPVGKNGKFRSQISLIR